ncbi:MAG TPA: hypothetical protein VGR11_11015, partial [Solirubrobacteraceae bacterium]|nr:hypothetical protein [Solirubrobacteraceae bacterium]
MPAHARAQLLESAADRDERDLQTAMAAREPFESIPRIEAARAARRGQTEHERAALDQLAHVEHRRTAHVTGRAAAGIALASGARGRHVGVAGVVLVVADDVGGRQHDREGRQRLSGRQARRSGCLRARGLDRQGGHRQDRDDADHPRTAVPGNGASGRGSALRLRHRRFTLARVVLPRLRIEPERTALAAHA